MPNLTKRFVDGLKADPAGKDVTHWDDVVKGFCARVKPSGARSWIIQYRNKHGRLRKFTLGAIGVVTPDQARTRAKRLLADIESGADPAEDKRKDREAATVNDLCEQYLAAGEGVIKASTLKMDRSRIERHVKPLIGNRSVKGLTKSDVEKFMRDIIAGKTAERLNDGEDRRRGGIAKGGAAVASRTVGMLGTILERAVRDGVIPSNPARGIKRPQDTPRKPPFSFEKVQALGRALREAQAEGENPKAIDAVKLLLLTGCRRMEILTLRWDAIDAKAHCFRFGDTKSGPQNRPIGKAAVQLLANIPRNAKEEFVFPGESESGHFVGLPKAWARIAERAKLELPIHGLRHWYASAASEMNFSELTIAGLLGHAVKGVTARYATAPDSALVAAADRVSMRLEDALMGRSSTARVVNIR